MNYTYKIEKLLPKQEFMVVVYSADGYPDYTKTFNPTSFAQADIEMLITSAAFIVVDFWERWASHPEENEVSVQLQGSAEYVPPAQVDFNHAPVIEPEPAYDPFTQRITLNSIEDPMQATIGWTVHDMTVEEQAEYLANWRKGFMVTMRQARLALLQEGYLSQIEDAINLIPEPDKSKVQTEWEYSAVVQRGSVWVAIMQPALGLSDEQMDDLFKLASTL